MSLETSVYHLDKNRKTFRQFLSEHSVEDLIENLARQLEKGDVTQFRTVMTIIKNEQDKVKQYPEVYKFCEQEFSDFKRKHIFRLTKEHIAEYKFPIHPSYLINRIRDAKFTLGQN